MNSDQHKGLRRLAAEVLRVAVEDYKRKGATREERQMCARFLVSNSYWHQALNLNPEYCAKWLRKQIERVK